MRVLKFKIMESIRTAIAVILFKIGVKPGTSSDLFGDITKGYGKLHDLGFWEYEIPPKYFKNSFPPTNR